MKIHQIAGLSIPVDDPVWMADLVLQRTGPLLTLGGGHVLAEWVHTGNRQPLETLCSDPGFVSQYLDVVVGEALVEAESLEPLLDGQARLCSIGPGNGLVELFLCRNTNANHILLIDIERTAEHRHGFELAGSGYASLQKTKQFMEMNGITGPSIQLCNPRREALPEFTFDVLISIMSMGFHYPCDEYVNFIRANCRQSGRVIFDKRKGVKDPGYDRLAVHFSGETLSENHKWQRLVLRPLSPER